MSCAEEPNQPEKNECGGYYCSEEHGHIDCKHAKQEQVQAITAPALLAENHNPDSVDNPNPRNQMKSAENWLKEYPESIASVATIQAIQADAFTAGERKGMERAVEIVLEYSKAMCGAHVNTNDSCGTIRRAILNAAKEVK